MTILDMNPGIVIGAAAAAVGVFSALAALYLWAVKRGRHKFENAPSPQERAVLPWLAPLTLPILVILCLAVVSGILHAFEEQSWERVSKVVVMFMILIFWLRIYMKVRSLQLLSVSPDKPEPDGA